jgi:hypothetical protein
MDINLGVWDYYQPGFVHPEFAPYLRKKVKDRWGNTVSLNTWEKQGCNALVEPALVRANWGMTFQRMYETDPCPTGFRKAPGGYCVQEPLKHEPVFYTDKAFIPKIQYWSGYTDRSLPDQRVSQQFDMRSVSPLTGQYEVPFLPQITGDRTRYARPQSVYPENERFDHSWHLPRQRGYQGLPTTDSYLA